MFNVAALAFGLGILFNAAPGVVFTESLRRGMRGGFKSAFAVQVGSLVGDATWAILGLIGVGALFLLDGVRIPLMLVGALLTVGLGVMSLRGAIRPPATAEGSGAVSEDLTKGGLAVGATISLTNPMNVVYWGGAAAAVAGAVGQEPSWQVMAVFFLGFFIASLLWCWICAGAIAMFRRALPARGVQAIEAACGISLVGLGIWMALSA
ncbi:Lysine exporter protein (LYSE/YGGA) [Kribbella flavida DSM 17836]|uniref:Lysine exporter protein (LYSE/YGGA) n=1 Tax=Kribbella flavida (strain DSM 17836 / JCM 10339 / NBRC 14399) TaxID=479435 RepID=D2PS32_KRIFD|nr:LysE family transporter [Kribbella flavida]ADB31156.1 Lysine exporter protein (LYSE/YGGA) [Kribbella flavida DSM 17836]